MHTVDNHSTSSVLDFLNGPPRSILVDRRRRP